MGVVRSITFRLATACCIACPDKFGQLSQISVLILPWTIMMFHCNSCMMYSDVAGASMGITMVNREYRSTATSTEGDFVLFSGGSLSSSMAQTWAGEVTFIIDRTASALFLQGLSLVSEHMLHSSCICWHAFFIPSKWNLCDSIACNLRGPLCMRGPFGWFQPPRPEAM